MMFSPYGVFANIYRNSVDSNALAPSTWRPQLPSPEREATYLEWREATVEKISRTLWPEWDAVSMDWKGGDIDMMLELTKADFRLFSILATDNCLDKQPQSPVAAANIPTHRQYFQDEDTAKLADRYNYYDTTLPTGQLERVLPVLRQTLKDKAGSVSVQIKQLIQRPRPYQVAKQLGIEHRFDLALTSMTSSMSSGHCFQGCLVAAGIYEDWLRSGFVPSPGQEQALGQFGVDIGDRRVFAGVHYPSDNLSSWIMALSLVDEVSSDVRVGKFLAVSITQHSHIFGLIRDSHENAHQAALNAVIELASKK